VIVFEDQLWLIAGSAEGFKTDVWTSTDGATWTRQTAEAGFTARYHHQVVLFHDKLWAIAGHAGPVQSDVWSSTDGTTWVEETAAAEFPAREAHQVVVFNDKLWLIGGYGTSGITDDAWSSDNGVSWTQVTTTSGVTLRKNHQTVVFNNSLMVIGGFASGLKNEVWVSADGSNWKMPYHMAVDFEVTYYQVSVTESANGTVTPTSQTVASGDNIVLTITPNNHYRLNSISGCGGSILNPMASTYYTVNGVTSDCSISAVFDAIMMTVGSTTIGNGSLEPASMDLIEGSSASMRVIPGARQELASISGCNGRLDGDNYVLSNLTESCNITAEFRAKARTPTPAVKDDTVDESPVVPSEPVTAEEVATPSQRKGGAMSIFILLTLLSLFLQRSRIKHTVR
jgi:hypothetical protein